MVQDAAVAPAGAAEGIPERSLDAVGLRPRVETHGVICLVRLQFSRLGRRVIAAPFGPAEQAGLREQDGLHRNTGGREFRANEVELTEDHSAAVTPEVIVPFPVDAIDTA